MARITAHFGEANTGADVRYTILNSDGTVAQARTSSGVAEDGIGTGLYAVEVADSLLAGKTVRWDINGTTKRASQTFPLITSSSYATGAIDANAFAQGAADKAWSTATRVLTAGTNIAFPAVPSASDNATAVLSATVGVDTLADLLLDMGAALVGKLGISTDGNTVTVKAPGTDVTRLVYVTDTGNQRLSVTRSR